MLTPTFSVIRPMVTSKSTVLGLRLDHDRRAWVEAEAARRGITVRVLFEGLIDGAQTGEAAARSSAAAGSEPAPGPGVDDRAAELHTSRPGSDAMPAGTSKGSWTSLPSGSSPWPVIGSVTALPGRLIRGAFSLPTKVIKTSSRCARKNLESCPALKMWGGRSS